jgi:hypothetical protein
MIEEQIETSGLGVIKGENNEKWGWRITSVEAIAVNCAELGDGPVNQRGNRKVGITTDNSSGGTTFPWK